ncbi:MAG: ABC transporter permease [Anaerolineae bacterium]|nr:ABC transporter permease [Phycisphaerae bacterium]
MTDLPEPIATETDGVPPASGLAPYEPAQTRQDIEQSRTFLQQTLRDTFSRPGARIGLVWIGILATLGVFAPFIANSEPWLVKQGGKISSPLLGSLSAPDVTLAAIYITAVTLLFLRRFSLSKSVAIIAGVGLLVGVVSALALKSKDAPIYEKWRQAQTEGKLEWVRRTIVPYSPNDRMNELTTDKLYGPDRTHWLGTSIFGEDVLSRMIHACRVALTIGLLSTGLAVIIGVTVGGFMGYFSGWFDLLSMRMIEILEAIPRLILLLIVAVFFRTAANEYGISMIYVMMVVIGLIAWTADARFVRAEFLRLRNQDFVHAARALGLPLRSIIFRHMLPNGIAPVLVNASFGVAGAILLESTLSFLGLGLGAEDPSWGQLLNQARSGGTGFNWWIATFPGAAIFLTVFSYVLIGEAMRDALDPRLRKRD